MSAAIQANTPLVELEGIGPVRAKALASLGLQTAADLLEYFPRAYQREAGEEAETLVAEQVHTVRGIVRAVDYVPSRGRARFEATLDRDGAPVALVWFNGAYLRARIHPGKTLRVRGKVKVFRGIPQMANPKWEIIDENDAPEVGSGIRPVYAASANMPSERLGELVASVLPALLPLVDDYLDDAARKRRQLMPRRAAYETIHRPNSFIEAAAARKRLTYDELVLLQLGLAIGKRIRDGRLTAPSLRIDKLLDERIRRRFPFNLTDAQQRCIWEVMHDMRSGRPMNRLLQGDVGSGKTSVALYAMLAAVANKLQAALLAPTAVLAEQHYLTLKAAMAGSSVSVELVSATSRKKERGRHLAALAEGSAHIAVGTQALLTQDVEFANLGLVVVDEQHKLGVRQRADFRGKGSSPHYLVMTATPIPRTLALSYFADFDVSQIDELPPGRTPIKTRWLPCDQTGRAHELLRTEVAAGRQAYIVLPQIDEDTIDNSKGVVAEYERLSRGPLAGLRLAMLHGQLPPEQKQRVMADFRERKTDVLVATTVIEVGVDVPNASVMLIESADRFGLSQLHQLRGRVGRGAAQSHCILLSDAQSEEAVARLSAMVKTNDGFEIAETDMKLRGPGDFLGTRQHGLPALKLADITQEFELLDEAREDALALLASDPNLMQPSHHALRERLVSQFGDSLPLAQIG